MDMSIKYEINNDWVYAAIIGKNKEAKTNKKGKFDIFIYRNLISISNIR